MTGPNYDKIPDYIKSYRCIDSEIRVCDDTIPLIHVEINNANSLTEAE